MTQKTKRFVQWTATALGAAGLGALTLTAPADAAPAPAGMHKVESVMRIGGFDAAVAAAHGYEIRTAADGRQYSARKATPAAVTPDNEVGDTCGRSWLYEMGIGNAAVNLNTGFSVRAAVTGRSWNVVLDDNGGVSTQPFSGGASGPFWDESRNVGGLTRGGGSAVVRSDGSNFAILVDGSVCYSGGPSDSTLIF